jgi:GntR family transcriptional regulator
MTSNPGRIEFDSNIPYYVQLVNLLKSQIAQKTWLPGDKIPGEPELCKEYGISRTVVRQALDELEHANLIIRRKGKGTFIALPKISESLAQKLTGFYHDMVARGFKPETQILRHKVVEANEKVARYLEIPIGTRIVDIKRLRSINEVPVQLVTSYLPYQLCPKLADVDLTNRSLYDFLEQECGLFIARGRRFIEAVAANEVDAKLLQVERGAPMVQLESISYLDNGTPVEYYHALHRGDRSRFEIELVRGRELVDPIDRLNAIVDELPASTVIISTYEKPGSQKESA